MRNPRFISSAAKRSAPTGCALWGIRLFILPHTLVGIFLIWQVLVTAAWLVAGDDMIARITHAWPNQGKKGISYEIEYVYKDGPVEYSEKTNVSEAFYNQIPAAIKVAGPPAKSAPVNETCPTSIRLLSVGRVRHVALTPPAGGAPFMHFLGTVGIALFWNGILSIFVYQVWIKPFRMRS